nr:CDC27 family protein [Desulfobacterales bacterium]
MRAAWIQAVAGWCLFASLPASACGPYFPNSLLDGGDNQILSAPVAGFAAEIQKLGLPTATYSACPSKSGRQASDGKDAELADLQQALSASGLRSEQASRVWEAHAAERGKLIEYLQARQNWDSSFAWISNNSVPPPAFPSIRIVEGLPLEFAGYFRGAVAWNAGDTNAARKAWAAVLELPAAKRRFKSTWAAYMLGRSWEESRPAKAEACYQSVRRLVDEGMQDRIGLAAASLGREGLIHYRANDPQAAIALYWQQAAAGDPGALISLRLTAARALETRHPSLKALARDTLSRRVITAYLVSSVYLPPVHLDGMIRETAINTLAKIKYFRGSAPNWHRYESAVILWLEAVETADLPSAEEAELVALAAYQAGKFETAARWLNQAPEANVLALWLRAKLLLREGKVDEAAAALALIVGRLRENPEDGGKQMEPAGPHRLGFEFRASPPARSPQDEALGELGALRLLQSDYTEALDALLRAGFWMDAAYVAERILTVEELKTYVDRHWAEPTRADFTATHSTGPGIDRGDVAGQAPALQIRHLLARRLARVDRRTEARPFFPPNLRPAFDALEASLELGRDPQASRSSRAAALWTAAQILRTNGMELVGTEMEPDWAVHEGQYEYGITATDRTNSL